MSNTTKGVFIFLLAFSILSMALLFDAIARMKRHGAPPFNKGLITAVLALPTPPERLILALDTRIWRGIFWLLAIALPLSSGLIAFPSQRPFAGLALLLLWTTLISFFSIWSWLYSVFNKFSS